ncbi:MAG: hypothetical protein U9O82_07665 [Thermodesulfobacteriota bacterium]|nr:hypothetical protein [Thermodesulfobacteriota bacterium]
MGQFKSQKQISGVENFAGFRLISQTMDSMSRVTSLTKEGWNKSGGLLTLNVRFQGTSEELAKLFADHYWGGHNMEITDLGPHHLDCFFQ